MDRTQHTKAQLKAEVRERKVGPNGAIGGPTSWVEAVDADRIRTVLAAADAGIVIGEAVIAPAPADAAPDAVAAAVAALVSAVSGGAAKASGLDENRVHAIVSEALADSVSVTVTRPCGAVVEVPRQHKRFATLLRYMGAGVPCLLVGPKGSGKSEAIRHAATALGFGFVADSFSMDSGRHDVFGFVDAQSRYVRSAFRDAFETGLVYCADELDNGTANLGAAFNLALANGHVSFPDTRVTKHDNFRMGATCNTLHGATEEHGGRESVDGALLDRFAVIDWAIDKSFERAIALANAKATAEATGRNVDTALEEAGAWVAGVHAVRKAMEAAGMPRFTPSPRASIYGARMLASGAPKAEAVDVLLVRGADRDTASRMRTAFNSADPNATPEEDGGNE